MSVKNKKGNRWQQDLFCIICFEPIKEGTMCKSCASFIYRKKKEEQEKRKMIKKISNF